MQPIEHAWSIVIDITNHCKKTCLYCSRYIRHLKPEQRYHMSPDVFRNALDSLEGWPTKISIIGGEPLLHPQFNEINRIIREYYPPVRKMLGSSKRSHLDFGNPKIGIFTSGLPGTTLAEPRINRDIRSTYGFVFFNPHSAEQEDKCRHQPLTIAIGEAVPDKNLREKLIDNCWVQKYWSPSINIKGAYFCEIAASIDFLLYDGENAWKVEKNWWKRTPDCDAFKKQRETLCEYCGMAIPQKREKILNKIEKFSPQLLALFREKKLRYAQNNQVEVVDKKLSKEEIRNNMGDWYPFNYREDIRRDDLLENFRTSIDLD